MKNFTNGALVFRLWRPDGSGEVIAKFAYMRDAELFAAAYTTGCDKTDSWFLVVVCEHDCELKSFMPQPLSNERGAMS